MHGFRLLVICQLRTSSFERLTCTQQISCKSIERSQMWNFRLFLVPTFMKKTLCYARCMMQGRVKNFQYHHLLVLQVLCYIYIYTTDTSILMLSVPNFNISTHTHLRKNRKDLLQCNEIYDYSNVHKNFIPSTEKTVFSVILYFW